MQIVNLVIFVIGMIGFFISLTIIFFIVFIRDDRQKNKNKQLKTVIHTPLLPFAFFCHFVKLFPHFLNISVNFLSHSCLHFEFLEKKKQIKALNNK